MWLSLSLLVLVSQAGPATAPTRKDGLTRTSAAAEVLFTTGAATVHTARADDFPLAKGGLLRRDDTLTLPPGATAALLLLRNNQVVRLDDDLSLSVVDLALLDAPAATSSVKQQVERLFSRQELEGGVARLMGWHDGQAAAAVPSASTETEKSEEWARSAPPTKGGGGSNKPVSAPTEPAQPQAPPPPPPPPPARRPSPSKPAPPPDLEPVAARHLTRGEPPETAIVLRADETLSACLAAEAPTWGPKVSERVDHHVVLQARRRDGVLVLRLSHQLPVPPCARTWLEAQAQGTANASWTVDVALP
jgi:hypothetical protein